MSLEAKAWGLHKELSDSINKLDKFQTLETELLIYIRDWKKGYISDKDLNNKINLIQKFLD